MSRPAGHNPNRIRLRSGPRRRADRRPRRPYGGGGARAHHRSGRAQPLRDRCPDARPRRRGHRRAVARPTAARAGRGRRTGRRAPRRRRRLAPRGRQARSAGSGRQRPPRCAADAGCRRHLRWCTSGSTDDGPAGRCAGRGDGADCPLAGPAGRSHCARRTRLGDAGGSSRTLGGLGGVGPIGARGGRTGSRGREEHLNPAPFRPFE